MTLDRQCQAVLDAAARAEGGSVFDARTPEEYAEAHAEGAINVPIAELDGYQAATRPVTMCGSTGRGEKAADILTGNGVTNVLVMEGGLKAWREAGFPVA